MAGNLNPPGAPAQGKGAPNLPKVSDWSARTTAGEWLANEDGDVVVKVPSSVTINPVWDAHGPGAAR